MPIACPYCEHRINLKVAKPGRYRPRCPKCERPFALTVPQSAEAMLEVRAIEVDPTIASRPAVKPRTAAGSKAVSLPAAPSSSHLFGFALTNPELREESSSHNEQSASTAKRQADKDHAPPKSDVKGYRILMELGRGGMGTIFLAKQLSLDRPVALKIMAKRWASDPTFVARFTREAYAAAQLSHPNIVQIHDIGEVDGSRFFSMEFVPGRSLADVVRLQGKLDPEAAVGYILQAARGLKHAHDRGMIHRDVKPDNLLLDEQGLVKVADLGLVKTGTSDDPRIDRSSIQNTEFHNPNLTGVRIALGTPAYMSPEQCRDAAAVDHRADIYSLGCTLYVLVTGRPPFHGTTAIELMTKQAYEPIVPPERIVARVPAELSAVIQRMMAKSPDERFQTMDEVVRTLEAWIGVRTTGNFCPREEEISQLEGLVQSFNAAPKAVLRGRVVQGFFALAVLASILMLFFGRAGWTLGVVGLIVQSSAAYFVVDGIARKGPLFTRTRQFLWGLGWWDWLLTLAAGGLFALLLAMSGVFWIWVGFGLIGIGLAFALRYSLDRPADVERQKPLETCEKLLRRLRARGLDEEDLRQFVAKFTGRHWEAFFEALFGYEAKLATRAALLRGGSAGPREKHAAWREPLLHVMDRIETARKEARERRMLAAVERSRLLAEGTSQVEAERQARAAADAMVRTADQVRQAEAERVRIGAAPANAAFVANIANGAI
ncbi:MAG TPA: serine/threonine-protein kinase, partial [Urbifossiella sp.]